VIIPPLITMLVSGFWHGSKLTFIFWGLYHAFFYTLVVYLRNVKKIGNQPKGVTGKIFSILINFGVITVGWILFRADSIQSAFLIFKNIFVKSTTLEMVLKNVNYLDYLISLVSVILVFCFEIITETSHKKIQIDTMPLLLRWLIYVFIMLCITIFGTYQQGVSQFIYGKF
jgi:alginate O-acetyltransferase complex protein AlgI